MPMHPFRLISVPSFVRRCAPVLAIALCSCGGGGGASPAAVPAAVAESPSTVATTTSDAAVSLPVTTPAPPVTTPALPVTTPTLPVNGPAVPVVAHAWSVLGVTTDDPNTDTASQVDALAALPRRPALRVVLDQGTAPADYVDSVRKLAAVADVMALPLDSSDMKKLDAGQAGDRARRYLEALQDAAPIWEVGNEVNGNWVGTDPVGKIEAMYDAAKAYGKQTAVTFYCLHENPATPGHDMLPWIDANIPAGPSPAQRPRLRASWSYYEDQNGGHQLSRKPRSTRSSPASRNAFRMPGWASANSAGAARSPRTPRRAPA